MKMFEIKNKCQTFLNVNYSSILENNLLEKIKLKVHGN